MSQSQTFIVYRGEDASIVLTGEDDTNPTGWALLVTWSVYDGQDPVTGSTTTVTVGGSGPYTLTVAFTRAQTSAMTRHKYRVDVWRTDSGSNIRLAGGTLHIETPVRLPA
jgi:hypothetical protein